MKSSRILLALAGCVLLVGLILGVRILGRDGDGDPGQGVEPAGTTSPDTASSRATETRSMAEEVHQGLLHGRVTTVGGAVYEGRLRFGGDEEALWVQSFNGTKRENSWADQVPPDRLPRERRAFELFGVEIALGSRPVDLARPFMVRFGDIARIEAHGRDLRVTLASGTVFHLDRFGADDLADGVRVWDDERGVVDLHEVRILSIEFLPAGRAAAGSDAESGPSPSTPLHGTVRTRQGDFTGFIQWNREQCLGSDELTGRTVDGEVRLRFHTIRSIATLSPDSLRVTLRDGRDIVLSEARAPGAGNHVVSVHGRRYGRVSISRDAFERVDFSPGGDGPAYDDFPPGGPLEGTLTTRTGRRLAGRLVYDLDEGETSETLDAPSRGVHYTIPFGRIASIAPPDRYGEGTRLATVTLHHGEELRLEPAGDLGEDNAGMLVVVDGRPRPEYVPWTDVERIDLDRPPATEPLQGGR